MAFNTLILFAIFACVSCSRNPTATYQKEFDNLKGREIGESEARLLITLFVNEELAGKTFKDIEDNIHNYRKFTHEGWRVVELEGGRWIARFDPPVGQYVTASLDRTGATPKIEEYGNAQL